MQNRVRLTAVWIDLKAEQMIFSGRDLLADIRSERQILLVTLSLYIHIQDHEGAILDLNPDLLDRSDQIVVTLVAQHEYRGKELDQRGAANRLSFVDPGSVASDKHIHVAAEWRVPQVHRRWPTPLDLAYHVEGVDRVRPVFAASLRDKSALKVLINFATARTDNTALRGLPQSPPDNRLKPIDILGLNTAKCYTSLLEIAQ